MTFVNAVWSASDEVGLHKMFEEAIPDIASRVALYMIVASNNAIVKSARNQVRYYDAPDVDTASDTSLDEQLLTICRRFSHFEMSF